MIRRTYPLELGQELGPRQVRVRASTGALGRDGMIVVPAGIDLTHYRKNPVMLWQHDPAAPVARAASLQMDGADLCADVEFAPEGVSPKADEICGLVKAGVVNAVSIGFDPLESEPLDAKKPRGGHRIIRSELMEISFVSVPADREAVVLQREKKDEKPEGEYGDVKYADPGYQEDKKPRYPIDTAAHIKAAWNYIHEAKNQEPYSADEVDKIKAKIVAAWKEKIDKDGPPSARAEEEPAAADAGGERAAPPAIIRGMMDVGRLAWLMDCLCDVKAAAECESALEGDESEVPAMLAKVCHELGAALIAMTKEEVAERCGGDEVDPHDALGLDDDDVALVMAAPSPKIRQFRLAYLRAKAAYSAVGVRAGAKHSAATMRCFREAMDHHEEAMELHRCAMRSHTRAAQMVRALMDDGGEASKEIQTSAGVGEDEGSRSADYRRRQAELRELSPTTH